MLIKNILTSAKNILTHFTGIRKNILFSLIIIFACFLNILVYCKYNTSALTYQSSVGVGFTFNPSISVSLSGDLVINNLPPGSSSDSNIIDVTVSTNTSHGYTLVATAGTSTTNTNLVNNSNSSYNFASIATDANLVSLTTDNTWGYSYSNDNGTNWSNYSGLPLDNNDEGATGKELLATNNPVDNKTIKFKIGAKAATTQVAGTYTNTINFYAIANPVPMIVNDLIYLQDFATLPEDDSSSVRNLMIPGMQYTLKDVRDNKTYSIAKLADGNIWMTQSLDIAGGTALSSDNTDFESTYLLPTTDGWMINNNELILPLSNVVGFNLDNVAFLYNSNSTNCGENSPCYSYYSWDTATLGSGRSIEADNQDAPYSICPKGWRLPSTRSGIDSSSDYRKLMIALGGSSSIDTYDDNNNTSPSGTTMSNAIQSSPNNYTYSGFYHSQGFYRGGSYGSYWTSTSGYSDGGYIKARALLFDHDTVYSAANLGRMAGYSVRCVAR